MSQYTRDVTSILYPIIIVRVSVLVVLVSVITVVMILLTLYESPGDYQLLWLLAAAAVIVSNNIMIEMNRYQRLDHLYQTWVDK